MGAADGPERGDGGRRVEVAGTFHHIWLWEAEALVLTDTRGPDHAHRHAAVQVVVSLGEPTAMRIRDDDWHRCRATVVASDVPHAYDSRSQPTLGLWVDPTSTRGRDLTTRYLTDGELAVLAEDLVAQTAEVAPDPPDRPMSAAKARPVFEGVCARLLDRAPSSHPLDPRVAAVLGRLEGEVALPPVADLAASVGLSASRLQHLVRGQVGIPLSRWLLWRRTLAGLERMLAGASSTEAAHAVGFADASYFTRRFREFFGAPPTAAVEDTRTRFEVASRLDRRAA